MDPIYQHLRINHFPVILGIVAFAAAALALFVKRDGAWRYACITAILAAASAPIAYWTGLRAEDKAEGIDWYDAYSMGEHGDIALWAMIALLAAGIAAGVALMKPKPLTRWIVLVCAAATAGLVVWCGYEGGHIVRDVTTREE